MPPCQRNKRSFLDKVAKNCFLIRSSGSNPISFESYDSINLSMTGLPQQLRILNYVELNCQGKNPIIDSRIFLIILGQFFNHCVRISKSPSQRRCSHGKLARRIATGFGQSTGIAPFGALLDSSLTGKENWIFRKNITKYCPRPFQYIMN